MSPVVDTRNPVVLDASFLQGGWSTEPSHSCDRQHVRCEVFEAVVVAGSDGFFDLEVE
jgi:hypothetical protein